MHVAIWWKGILSIVKEENYIEHNKLVHKGSAGESKCTQK